MRESGRNWQTPNWQSIRPGTHANRRDILEEDRHQRGHHNEHEGGVVPTSYSTQLTSSFVIFIRIATSPANVALRFHLFTLCKIPDQTGIARIAAPSTAKG